MSRLYGRQASVTVLKQKGFFTQGVNAIIIRLLRIQFRAEKHLGKEPNSCRITITNLAPATRTLLEQKDLYVRLSAGFDGVEEHVFEGDLRWSESVPVDTEWETVLELGDGERAYRNARVARSFKNAVRVRDAVKECVDAMGVRVSPQSVASLSGVYAGGLAMSGPAQVELTRILNKVGKTWSIQNGVLQILGDKEVHRTQAAVIQQDKGMIGSPSFGSPPEKGKPPTLTIKNLLYPSLVPGGLASVNSLTARGLFKIQSIVHDGDTDGRIWETSVEGTPR